MKQKYICAFLLFCILIICSISCQDEVQIEQPVELPPDENTSIELEKEELYNYQTNKDMILYSMIRYDHVENKYYLDATDEDIEKLGITIEAQKDILTRIVQLNEANIDRQ